MTHTIRLKKKLERTLRQGHPWIFVDAISGTLPEAGKVVTVLDDRGRFLARGLSEAGPIGVRIFCTVDEPMDKNLFARRINAAVSLRREVIPLETDAYRLLHGEGDRLPGVICDVYGKYAVLQFDGQAAPVWMSTIVDCLEPQLRNSGIENLLLRTGRGKERKAKSLFGKLPTAEIQIFEHGMKLSVDLVKGQKTGLFLDHRESRHRARELAKGKSVLNLFGYTGGFSVAAGLGGATRVDTVDRDASACTLAEKSWVENGLSPELHKAHTSAVQVFCEAAAGQKRSWDLVICDPPSFAPSEKKVCSALNAYRALHTAALGRVKPGGLYLAASCSSHVNMEAFEGTVLHAATRRDGRVLQILERWSAPADHPRIAAFPEGDYLKVILARLIG